VKRGEDREFYFWCWFKGALAKILTKKIICFGNW
jgi:hypothetical protein